MHEVVITGYGVISPIGNNIEEFERRLFAGDSGIRDIRGNLVANNFPVPFAGVVDNSALPSAESLGLPSELVTKNVLFTILATKQALDYLQ